MNREKISSKLDQGLQTYIDLVRSLAGPEEREQFLWAEIWQTMVKYFQSVGDAYLKEGLGGESNWEPDGEAGRGLLEDPVNMVWMSSGELAVSETSASRLWFFKPNGESRALEKSIYAGTRLWSDRSGLWVACDAGRRVLLLDDRSRIEREWDLTKVMPDRDEAMHLINFAVHLGSFFFIMQNKSGNRRTIYEVSLNEPGVDCRRHTTDVLLWPRQFDSTGGRLTLSDHYIPLCEVWDAESACFRQNFRLIYSGENRGYCVIGKDIITATPTGMIFQNRLGGAYLSVARPSEGTNIRAIAAGPGQAESIAIMDVSSPKIRFFRKMR